MYLAEQSWRRSQMNKYHNPVLLEEAIDGLIIDKDGLYVDATFGGGGHSKEILARLSNGGKVYGLDRDSDALGNLIPDSRLELIQGNFRYLHKYLKLYDVDQVDGVLADLGVSSHQFDEQSRGFTYRSDVSLDMRMNQDQRLTAAEILMQYSETALVDLFSRYGEIRNSKTIAREIVKARSSRKIETTNFLIQILEPLIKGSRLRYLSQVFQALRIEVNDEMGALQDFLNDCSGVIRRGGRLVIITYHSIEDRMAKRFIKTGNVEGQIQKDEFGNVQRSFKEVNKKVIVPSSKEISENRRARSAKLRIAEKC